LRHCRFEVEDEGNGAETLYLSLLNETVRVTVRSKGMGVGRVTMTLTYILKHVNGGTILTYAMDYEMPGGFLASPW